MDFPRNYDTKAFPESRSIAFARFLGILSSLAFVVMVGLSVLFLWGRGSMTLEPYVIAINGGTGEWGVVTIQKDSVNEASMDRMIQESVVGQFAMQWFTISGNRQENNVLWCRCVREECFEPRGNRGDKPPCLLCCAAGDELYKKFERGTLPEYRDREQAGEIWALDRDSMFISSTEAGGKWVVEANLVSNYNGVRPVIMYATVMRSAQKYRLSFGYYVSDFDAFVTDMRPFPIPDFHPDFEDQDDENESVSRLTTDD
jgi:hypothetical protein